MNRWVHDRSMIETYRREILEKSSQLPKNCTKDRRSVIN